MKVLAKGSGAKGWSKEMKCSGNGNGGGGCGALLLVERNDLFTTSNSDMSGDTEYFTTFKCPECGVRTDLEGKDRPPSVIVSSLPSYAAWDRDQ